MLKFVFPSVQQRCIFNNTYLNIIDCGKAICSTNKGCLIYSTMEACIADCHSYFDTQCYSDGKTFWCSKNYRITKILMTLILLIIVSLYTAYLIRYSVEHKRLYRARYNYKNSKPELPPQSINEMMKNLPDRPTIGSAARLKK